jgi:hypothetical protein
MSDDRPEETTPSPDLGRPKRTPPTIDLEATEISTAAAADDGAGAAPPPDPEPAPAPQPDPGPAAVSPVVVAGISGAVAAALVIGVGWMLGWPQVSSNAPAAPQPNAAAIDGLAARIASVEAKSGKSAAATPDPAEAARLEALEKSLTSLRGDLAAQRAQSDKLAAEVNQVASAPRDATAAPDLSAINQRLSQIERTNKTQNAEIAQENAKPADDTALRRVVAAALLDLSVRQGDPYAAALTAAKSLSPDPDALKPLEEFAATGVPNAANLSRELLTLVPKLSPPADAAAPTGGIVDRLQEGASRLVRIERTDATGNNRGAVIARVTAAALHNESNEARRELMTLAPADRVAAQSWLAKADARDAALAASRKFAADAMTALAETRR